MASETCRIDGIVATEANKAVIFRRGPSRVFQLLTWDLSSDEIIEGQWIRARVYTPRCDVSPNGRYLVIAATDYRLKGTESLRGGEGWTAISRPPFFSAIALWFADGAWNGGGIWEDNSELSLNPTPRRWREITPASDIIKVSPLNLPYSETEPIFSMRLERRGWKTLVEYQSPTMTAESAERWKTMAETIRAGGNPSLQDLLFTPEWEGGQEGLMVKKFEGGSLQRVVCTPEDRWRALDEKGQVVRSWEPKKWYPQWIDVDARNRVIFGEAGCLWAWADFPNDEPKMIADLNNNKFEPIAPPKWAMEW